MKQLANDIIKEIVKELYKQRVLSNLLRPLYVERLLARLLAGNWKCVGGDWSGWDLEDGVSGLRIEVKQSAARQTWSKDKPTKPIFDIEERTGYYANGATWINGPGRPADIYIFAWHPGFHPKEAVDHTDPEQWEFYVVAERDLPVGQKSMGLAGILKLPHVPARHDTVGAKVDAMWPDLAPLKATRN